MSDPRTHPRGDRGREGAGRPADPHVEDVPGAVASTEAAPSCSYCGSTTAELRPYGPNGTWVCFPCAMATPERKAETARQFQAQHDAAGPVVIVGEETGPRPYGGARDA